MAAKDYTTRDAGGREMRLSSPATVYLSARDGRVQPSRARKDA